jgi:hypothetical protein
MRLHKSYWLLPILVLSCVLLLTASIPNVSTGTWQTWNNMDDVRSGAATVLLQDGRVLITGGTIANGPVASAVLFGTDGVFSDAATMLTPRSGHTATVLSDGRVLVTGGTTSGGAAVNTAEIYDPIVNSWSAPVTTVDARAGHTASLLSDGDVLLAGGHDSAGNALSSLEIFDPASGKFSSAGAMSAPRMNHAAATLGDSRVLIIGGTADGTIALASIDIYDPSAGIVSTGPVLSTPRMSATATTTLDGKVAVIGGNNGSANGSQDLVSAEIFDPATGQFSPSASNLVAARSGHHAFLLPKNNAILVVGGTSSGTDLNSAELYYPWADSFQSTGTLSVARPGLAGSAIGLDGRLLAAGGTGLASTELYGFATVKTDAADYPPGSTVMITGSGWQPGETVTLTLLESPLIDTHPAMTAVADGNGNILNDKFSPDEHDVNIRFYLTAVGSQSGLQAQNTFTDAAGDDTSTIVSCTPNSVTAGSATTCTATVNNIQSGAPNGFPHGEVNFQYNGTAGTFSFASNPCTLTQIGSTNNSQCTVTLTANQATATANVKGNYNPTDTNKWKNDVSPNFALTVNSGGFSHLQLLAPGETAAPGTATGKTGTPASHVAGAAFNVTVNAVDANWNLVTVTNVIQITSSDANATLPASAGLAGGTRAFSVTLKTTPSQTITASDVTDPTKAPSTSPSIRVTAASANKLVFGQQPTDANVGTTITPAITVKVEDSFNNVVTTSSAPVTLTITTGTGTVGAVLTCTSGLSHNASGGIATFPDCNINKAGTNYELHAVASGDTAVDSSQFIIISPVTKLGFTTPAMTGDANQCLGPINVQTQNTGGTGVNPSSPVEVDLSIISGGTGGFFSDAACGSSITNVNIPTIANSASFFFKATSTGSPTTIQAADHAGVLTSATQGETIGARSTTTVVSFSTNPVSYGNGTNATVTVTDTDANGTKSFPTGTVSVASDSGDTIAAPCTLASTATAGVSSCTVAITPTHASTHTISAGYPGDTAHSSSSDTGKALTVNAATVTVTFTAADKTYDGNTTAAVSNCTIATGKVGTDDVTCTVASGTFASSSAGASPQIVSATATLEGAKAGNYTVTNPVTTTAKINQATATVVVTPYSVAYDGHAHMATVTSITGVNGETGATVGTVNVSNTTHTNAGTYSIDSWSFTGTANYKDIAATTVTDKIDRADAAVVVTPYSVIYNGTPHTATVTSITGVNGETGATVGTVDVSNTTHINAGTYSIDSWSFTGTANYNNIAATTISDKIDKADAVVVVVPYSVTYNGNPHTATVTSITGVNSETGATVGAVTLNTTHTNAGTYSIDSWSFTGTANYNNIAATTISDKIDKADAVVVVTPYSVAYNGAAHTATGTAKGVLNENLSGLNLSGTTHTNPGDYLTDTWIFTDVTGNYNNDNGRVHDSIGYAACSLGAGGVILPPINSDGTSVYSRKGGSTIPVKFNVCGANGAPLTDPALVFAGTGGAVTMTGAIRGTMTVVNEKDTNDIPNAAFTWDGQQWHFNMATANLSSATTYTFRINLAYDPASILFTVGLK